MIFQRGGEKPPTSYQWYEIPAPVDFYVFLFLPPQLEIAGFKKDPELPDAKSAQEEEQRQVGRNKGGCLPGFQGDFSNVFSLLHKKLQRIKMIWAITDKNSGPWLSGFEQEGDGIRKRLGCNQ